VTRGNESLFSEDFANGSKEWSPEEGKWSVASGVYQQTDNAQPAISRMGRSAGEGDYVYTLRARKTGGTEGFLIGFNGVDANNYYWWNLGGWGNSRHAVEKSTDGIKEEVGPAVPGQIEMNKWYDIRIEVAKHKVRCILDGKLIREFTDDGFKSWQPLYASTVRDSATGDLIVKVVNTGEAAQKIQLDLDGDLKLNPEASTTVLTGKPLASNTLENPQAVKPVTSSTTVGATSKLDLPASSLTIVRMKTLKGQ